MKGITSPNDIGTVRAQSPTTSPIQGKMKRNWNFFKRMLEFLRYTFTDQVFIIRKLFKPIISCATCIDPFA